LTRRNNPLFPLIVFRHVPHEGVGTIATSLEKAEVPYRCIDTAQGNPSFPPLSSLPGLLVMGGPMGVYESNRYPFLKREVAYIRKAIEARKPVLGICLGAQLVAHALGAKVYPQKKKEIGWYRIHLTSEGKRDPLLRGSPPSPWVFHWHGDTFDLPPKAHRLASSSLCANQAFRFARHVYGLQYHLEVDAPMIREWLAVPGAKNDLKSVGPGTGQHIRKDLSHRIPGLHQIAEPFFDRWTRQLTRKPLSPTFKSAKLSF
jgi:GMP synthase (glutamine-hydrolysing)